MPRPPKPDRSFLYADALQKAAIDEREPERELMRHKYADLDLSALEETIAVLGIPKTVESVDATDFSLLDPKTKMGINRFSSRLQLEIVSHWDDVRKVGKMLVFLEQSRSDITDRLVEFFSREYDSMRKTYMLWDGDAFYEEMLRRLQGRVRKHALMDYYVKILMLYFFSRCDIFKKASDEPGAVEPRL